MQVFGIHELEQYRLGSGGIVAGILATARVPATALYSYLFFGQKMSVLGIVGALLIMAATSSMIIFRAIQENVEASKTDTNRNEEQPLQDKDTNQEKEQTKKDKKDKETE